VSDAQLEPFHTDFQTTRHAPAEARHALERYARTIEPSLLDDLKLVTSELVTNSVLHSGRPDKSIRLDLTLSDGVLKIEVVDCGKGCDVLVPRSTWPPSGLAVVSRIADRWSYQKSHSFHVRCEFDVGTDRLIHRESQTW
jgi:anti-sigma regulatory factor (Ser/Thr protein kinase)